MFEQRPTLNKKLFLVDRSSGSKRADLNFFFMIKKLRFFCVCFCPVHSCLYKNEMRGKKKIPTSQLVGIVPTWQTGNTFSLKGGQTK